jgi:hypothetical protein
VSASNSRKRTNGERALGAPTAVARTRFGADSRVILYIMNSGAARRT